MHTTTGNWRLGLAMALATTFMWGVLPVALAAVMAELDPLTVTCLRFGLAAIALVFAIAADLRSSKPAASGGTLAPRTISNR